MHTSFEGERRAAEDLADRFLTGAISRRQLFARAGKLSAAAVGASALGGVLAACGGKGGGRLDDRDGRHRPEAGRRAEGGADRRARQPRPGRVADLHRRPGLRQHLLEAHRHRARPAVLRRARDQVDADRRHARGRSTSSRTRRSTTASTFTADDVKYTFERILDPKTASGYAPLYSVDRRGRGREPDPGDLPPEDAVRPVPHEPRQQRRDREPEGDRERQGSGAKPGRHRAVPVRRVGAGRPRHAEAVPRLLQEGPAVPGRRRVPVPAGRPGPRRRARARASSTGRTRSRSSS